MDHPPGKDVRDIDDIGRGGKDNDNWSIQRQEQDHPHTFAKAAFVIAKLSDKDDGKKYGDRKEHGSNDHTAPDRVAVLNQVHPIDDIAANVKDEKPEIWLNIVINY